MRKQLFILAGIFSCIFSFAQTVNIPDANFKTYLVSNAAINTNGDNEIQVSEANVYTGGISCSYRNIASLIGIESFLALTQLECYNNKLTSLDISKNTLLSYLDISSNLILDIDVTKNINLVSLFTSYNPIKKLDVSKNLAISWLGCYNNQLTTLDVSKNVLLTRLGCSENPLTKLDVSKNLNLDLLYCGNTNIKSLDVSKNPNLGDFFPLPNYQLEKLNLKNGNNVRPNFTIIGNPPYAPKLFCVEVDNVDWYYQNGSYLLEYIGQGAVYSSNCNLTLSTNNIQKLQTKIYPNPVKNSLNIQTSNKLQKVEIYSTNGQLVKTSFLKETNVATLPKGNYVVKILTDKGGQTEKIIKE